MNSNFVQPIGNLTPNTAAMQLKYDYDQLDMPTGNTVRGAAIEIKAHAERADEDEDNEPYTSAMVNLAERENKSSSLMATPTAVDLQLPSISIPDKDLFMSQVKRSVGVLSEEGYATVANFLRIVGRYAFDAQPAPLDAPEAPRADDGGQSREERVVGMTSILETALMLVVEDYGQLTGKWTHVAPAERALKQLIEVLKENLTK